MDFPLASLRTSDVYALLTSLVVPRPIAWVTTVDAAGGTNLAPFSYFQALASDPALLTLAVSDKRDGTLKDTARIAQQTGALCVHLVEEPNHNAMNGSSAELPPGQSEIELLGLATVPCTAISGVRLVAARAALECKLVDVHRYGRKAKVSLLVCEVVHAHLDDAILERATDHPAEPARDLTESLRKTVDPRRIAPLARLGGSTYATLGTLISKERPKAG